MNWLRAMFLWMLTFTALLAGALALWILTPTSAFVKPVSLTIEGQYLTLVRETPRGEIGVRWSGEIVLLNDEGFECGGSGVRTIQPMTNNLIRGEIGPWAGPCLERGGPFVLRYSYVALLWGWLPLRPIEIAITVGDVPPFRQQAGKMDR